MESYTFTFDKLPESVDELMALPEAVIDTPYKTVALALLALLQYENDPELCHNLVDALRGPDPLSNMDKQFLRDRLKGSEYVVRSFFAGSAVDNNYTPSMPYTITVSENPYSFTEDNRATLYIKSSGADSPRPVALRRKPSTNQWFITSLSYLGSIRTPVELDPWA